MTRNRLVVASADVPTGKLSEETLREFCWKQNKRAAQAGWLFWIYVSKDKETDTMVTKSREGADALDVIKVLKGWYPDFINWDAERLADEFRILRYMARMGMPQVEFDKRISRLAKPQHALTN